MLSPIKIDRAIAKGRTGNLIVISLAVLLLVPFLMCLLGITGQYVVSLCEPYEGLSTGLFWDTLEVYLDPSNKPHDVGFSKRFYFLIVGTVGILLLDGLLVSMLVSWFESRKERWERGDLHYGRKPLGNYCVVIGGNDMVPDLVGQILEKKDIDHVLVMTSGNVSSLRKKMVSKLGKDEEKVVIYYGDRTSMEDLENLMLQNTQNDIYVIGEQPDVDDNDNHHDVRNMECVRKIAGILAGRNSQSEKKTCRVMFEYQSTFSIFQFADINREISGFIELKPFNFYETWAQKVLICKELNLQDNVPAYLPLEGKEPITSECDDSVHLVIVGMSRMGIALAVQTAYLAHYPNFVTKGKRTRITFIDPQAETEMRYMQGRYKELFTLSRWRYADAEIVCDEDNTIEKSQWHEPQYEGELLCGENAGNYLGEQFIDVEWQFVQGNMGMAPIQESLKHECRKSDVRLNIAVCIPKDNVSLATAIYLPNDIYEDESNVIQVLVYQSYSDAMCKSFANNSKELYRSYKIFAKLRSFGMKDGGYSLENQELLKKVSCAIDNEYGKSSQNKLPGRNQLRRQFNMETIKVGKTLGGRQWSGYYAAAHMWTKLRSIGYKGECHELETDDIIETLAKVEHVRWNMEQLLLGYAPLRYGDHVQLKKKREKAQKVPAPEQELAALHSGIKEKSDYVKVIEWLNVWKEYDEMKEMLKANMYHADICSFEVLEQIDEEAVEYDRELVRIIPRIYKQLFN